MLKRVAFNSRLQEPLDFRGTVFVVEAVAQYDPEPVSGKRARQAPACNGYL